MHDVSISLLSKVHYLSLDIEGGEMGVLRSLPWHNVDIWLLSVEVSSISSTDRNQKLLDSLFRPTMGLGFPLLASGTGILNSPKTIIAKTLSVNVRQELVNFMENQGYQWIGTAGAPVPTIFHSNSPHQ